MRHLGSFLLAIVLAPIVYLLTGVGLSAFTQAATRGAGERPMASVLSIATLAVAGIVYAVLVMARLSPVGPALVGFLFLATPAWPLVDLAGYTNALNTLDARFKILGVEILGIDLVGRSGVGVLLAIPLIATLASPRRWSRYADRPAAEVAYYAQNTGYQQQPYAYGAPTRPMDPVTEQLPDVSPPTLHYPRSSSAAAAAPARPAEPPAAPTVVLQAPAAPAPAPAPAAAAAPKARPAAAPAPAAPAAPKAPPAPAVAAAPKAPTIPADATSLIAAEAPKVEAPKPQASVTPKPAESPKSEAPEVEAPKQAEPVEQDSDKTVRIDPDTLKPI